MQRSTHEKMLLALSGLTVVTILPFAIYRLLNDFITLAILNSIIASISLILFLYVFKTRKVELPSMILVFLVIAGSLIGISLKGLPMVYWLYPSMISTYYLLKPKVSMFVGAVTIVSVFLITHDSEDATARIYIIVTIISTNVFAYIFSDTLRKKNDELKTLITIDPLTGAKNRRALTEKLDLLIKEQRRTPTSVCLIILDIDYFKRINDELGHLVGDKVLSEMTNVIINRIRQTESVYRFGGEEFIIAPLPIALSSAKNLAEKLRGLVEFTEIIPDKTITISLGVAQYKQNETVSDWINRADGALYDAKKSGRNKVSVAK